MCVWLCSVYIILIIIMPSAAWHALIWGGGNLVEESTINPVLETSK